jgi:hypothetical protein
VSHSLFDPWGKPPLFPLSSRAEPRDLRFPQPASDFDESESGRINGSVRSVKTVIEVGSITSLQLLTPGLRANLNDDGAHSVTTRIFPVRLLDLVKLESGPDRDGNPSIPKPFKEVLQVGRKVL